MAWFSGKVTLGNFADLAGAVNKISESVKNIEKNFDSALGFEDKAGGGTTSSNEGKQGRVAFTAKATTGSSESSSSLKTVDSAQSLLDKPEDLIALLGVGFAFVVALWASLSVITAIDKLPVLPGLFELIGIVFSTWFVYRYLLFKPDRKELAEIIKKSLADIIGQ